MVSITDIGALTGSISAECTLSGVISVSSGSSQADTYTGEYQVTPRTDKAQTLATKGKLMSDDVVVEKIAYVEVTNTSGGFTAYIAAEV